MQPNRYGNYYRGAVSERFHPIYDTDRCVHCNKRTHTAACNTRVMEMSRTRIRGYSSSKLRVLNSDFQGAIH